MIKLNKKALIIGETGLCIQCIHYLLEAHWQVVGVVSDDKTIWEWAANHSLACFYTHELSKITETDFYLFSIINPVLIQRAFISDRKIKLALNYHDSLLPQYAGVNSTTWAIINDEKQHGVSLHVISDGIDEGDIVGQVPIVIEPNETALSLNLKCSEALLVLFKKTLSQIETNTLQFSPQILENKTYYGLRHLPENYGIINGIQTSGALDQLTHGLTFGEKYDNPIATVKFIQNNQCFVLDASTVRDIYGHPVDIDMNMAAIQSSEYHLNADALAYLAQLKIKEKKIKQQWRALLENTDAALKVLDYIPDEQTQLPCSEAISLPKTFTESQAVSLIYIVLSQFFYQKFWVSCYLSDSDIPENLRCLVEHRQLMLMDSALLTHDIATLRAILDKNHQETKTITKDFGYRYHIDLLTDIAIIFGEVVCTDRHPIKINIYKQQIKITGNHAYQTLIHSIAQCIHHLINKDLNTNLNTISLLNEQQYHHFVYTFNNTAKPYPKNKTIHALFEEQALKTPDSIALVSDETTLTYQSLNQKANQLAHYLHHHYLIKPDDLIIVCLDKNVNLLIAILAILKTGAAYVSVDPKNPDNRIQYIVKDTQAKIILTNENHAQLFHQHKMVLVNDVLLQQCPMEYTTNLLIPINSNNLAYVMYTSGTTGNPKGVMIEHKGVVSLVKGIDYVNISAKDCFLQLADIAFDAATFEIWGALLNGSRLYLIKNMLALISDIAIFEQYLITHKITILLLIKSLFDQIYLANHQLFRHLNYLLVGGETLNCKLIKNLLDSPYKPKHIINAYGPTENTTCSCTYEINAHGLFQMQSVPIGKPISNRTAYVLNEYLMPLPIGAIGELYVGGEGLSRGYLNDKKFNNHFIAHPFQMGYKLYKTGDLVRLTENEGIEYLRRNDTQVKINGYRIELTEIENKLIKYDSIKKVFLTTKSHLNDKMDSKYLVAYYIANNKIDESKLYHYLENQLPCYMIPNMFIHVKNFSLTSNGKLDKNKLPEPEFNLEVNHKTQEALYFKLQQKIIDIWSDILNIPRNCVNVRHGFFQLGGNSLLLIQLKNQLSSITEFKNIALIDLFKYHTIEQLTNFAISYEKNATALVVEPLEKIFSQSSDIAIIEISGAFSGCDNVEQYWDLIQSGAEGVKRFSIEQCEKLGISEKILKDACFVPVSGHLHDIDTFDHEFWNLSPNEAQLLDPQIRKFLEHCWFVLESSGYLNERHKMNIAVFAGSGNSNYLKNDNQENLQIGTRSISYLTAKDSIATKISYLLGLTGISININTACSTSLVTVIEACKQLSSGYCDMAIAGGVSLLLPEEIGHIYQEGLIYSKDGHCSVFDNNSSGIVHGSGVGVVLLKRLADAQKDNDKIFAVINGYAINNDGNRKAGYMAPSIAGQKECILNAQKMAKMSSDLIGYVECHGTGTRLGDPVEMQALQEAFKSNKSAVHKRHSCMIGSVKANIGHADSAAGIAGLLKICKMIEHKTIPRQINYKELNAEININIENFSIPKKTQAWTAPNNLPRVAAVSAFGIGGTNAHMIISEYIAKENISNKKIDNGKIYILPLSAKTESSLNQYVESFIEYLEKTSDHIEDIAYTLQKKREFFDYKTAISASSRLEAARKFKHHKKFYKANYIQPQHVIFCFPGQGNQYVNMSYSLYQNDIDFKNILDQCISLVNKNTRVQFEKILFSKETHEHDIHQTQWAQPALFIVSYSLAKLLEKLNIHAVAYIGHSIGEWVAATLSGVFTLEDAIKLIIVRGKLMQSMSKGSMLSIQSSVSAVNDLVTKNNCELSVINSVENCVASGSINDIKRLKNACDKMNIASIILNVSHAYHSESMKKASEQFFSILKKVTLKEPNKRFISNITGNFIKNEEAINPEYWSAQICQHVLFSEGIKTLLNAYEHMFFIEVGAGKSSLSFVHQNNVKNDSIYTLQLLNSSKDNHNLVADISTQEEILCKLWEVGYQVNFSYLKEQCLYLNRVRLPCYAFEKKIHWITLYQNNKMISSIESNKFDNLKKIVEKNLPAHYYEIAEIFLDVLGVEKISIYDDFFDLGGDSLLAISLSTKLQRNFKIHVADIFKSRCIAKIAEFSAFSKNNLHKKLEEIKLYYLNNTKQTKISSIHRQYLKKIEHLIVSDQRKDIHNVLLTGATGHLGVNILDKLLSETSYNIYLLVRSESDEQAYNRVNSILKHYLNNALDVHKNRIIIILSDIEKPNLGLHNEIYKSLVSKIDSIIHSAALVRHYGESDKFYSANVQATINLLELVKLTKTKDFHYVSTIASLIDGIIPNTKSCTLTEEDDVDIITDRGVYSRTKYESEVILAQYRQYGITGNIYRAGNIAMHSETYCHQINLEDNAFFSNLKTFLSLGIITEKVAHVEITPVDYVALAIVKIFDKVDLSNQTYHLFNPYFCDLQKIFDQYRLNIKSLNINDFINVLSEKLEDPIYSNQVELFMLHQLWLREININDLTHIKILQNKTNRILKNLGIYWPKISKKMFSKIIPYALQDK